MSASLPPGYRVDPEAVIQIPDDQVYLGYPGQPPLAPTRLASTFSSVTSLT